MKLNKLILLLVLFAGVKALPQEEHHQFDFWIGDWNVYKYGTDSLVGKSHVKSILNHKTIEENYSSTLYPYAGKSYNIYNSKTKKWEQFWVDNSGMRLSLNGGIVDGKMILSGCEQDTICNKIIWSALLDKTVRQEWLHSEDMGKTWRKVFDGLYKSASLEKEGVKEVLGNLEDFTNVRDFTVSTSGKEAYFTAQSPNEEISVIISVTKLNDFWVSPRILSFSGK
ncbi:MAG: hypothetical protein KDC69_11425, partial [Flavobacteriaceae bacterium]|nr:hypothetical protein [Flavobacteriaceae bacterium]